MQLSKVYNPFIRVSDSTLKVMSDVVLSLIPCLIMSYLAFGFVPIILVFTAIGSAVLAEIIFSCIFYHRINSITDGSAIVTGILLAFTVGSFTPLYIVAFGGAMGVIFGKLLWGGLGRNVFNPALVGREFMTIFFPTVMTSGSIWYDKTAVNLKEINLFGNDLFNELLFRPSGAVGEYSIIFLVCGGLYLLIRRRISWHIPFFLLLAFISLLMIYTGSNITFSLGGLLLGTIFMATDMPSSASTNWGKCFYGAMVGFAAIIFIINGVKYEYMSYSILLANAFVYPINWAFRPKPWGKKLDFISRLWQISCITSSIALNIFAIIYLHQLNAIQYLLYVYIAFCIIRFIMIETRRK